MKAFLIDLAIGVTMVTALRLAGHLDAWSLVGGCVFKAIVDGLNASRRGQS